MVAAIAGDEIGDSLDARLVDHPLQRQPEHLGAIRRPKHFDTEVFRALKLVGSDVVHAVFEKLQDAIEDSSDDVGDAIDS